jgi:cytochrome c-type biogenesis protein CcmE
VTDVRDADDPGAGEGYDESPELDLTPRTSAADSAVRVRSTRRRPIGAYVVLAAIVVGVGFVLLRGLGDATLYFRNVDEAVEQRDSLGDRRFRLQGLVRNDVVRDGEHVAFTITFNGVDLAVQHTGDAPDLFQPGEPVVLEGHLVGGGDPLYFASDRILVKHTEEYEAEHDDRVTDAEDGNEDAP